MVENVVIEMNETGHGIRLLVDGMDCSKANGATLTMEPGCIPVLTLTIPFRRCELRGVKTRLRFSPGEESIINVIKAVLRSYDMGEERR